MNLQENYKRIFKNKTRSNDGKLINEAISLKVGDEYSVMDYGDGEFRDGLQYLGYSRNEKSHVFSGPDGSPGSNEVFLMFVEKGDEETHVR